MKKIIPLLLIGYLAVYLSDRPKNEIKELPAKEKGFPTETLTILDSYKKNSLTRSDYLKDAFATTSKLKLPAHLLVN